MRGITNLYSDPQALRQLNVWWCSAQKNGAGKYVYTSNNNVWSAILPEVRAGCVVAVDFDTSRRDLFSLENCSEIYRGASTLAGIYRIGNCSLYCVNGVGVSATVNRIGVYSQDDWQRLRQCGLEWFDGDTMPLQR
nr:MAG TPA: Signal transduction protein [Caudoviricetes sp.]